jgi:tRNA threonylcarbamoyladenosine biosynthesis protein TsaE
MLHTFHIPDHNTLKHLANQIASNLAMGDVIALFGDLGTGKTTLSRYIINSLLKKPVDVISPTFNIVQTYDTSQGTVWHFDLYRLNNVEEVIELGIEDAFNFGISLIEWPEIIEGHLPRNHTTISIGFGVNPDERIIHVKTTMNLTL